MAALVVGCYLIHCITAQQDDDSGSKLLTGGQRGWKVQRCERECETHSLALTLHQHGQQLSALLTSLRYRPQSNIGYAVYEYYCGHARQSLSTNHPLWGFLIIAVSVEKMYIYYKKIHGMKEEAGHRVQSRSLGIGV